MADTNRNIFSLSEYSDNTIAGEGISLPSVWGRDGLQHVGYVVGGADGSNNLVSYYQSITYSNDTRSNVANLPQGRSGVYGLASPINGYAVGGGSANSDSPGTYYSSSNRLTFSTQTNSALPGVNMGVAFARGGSAGSSTAGYIAGGYSNPGESTGWSRLEKLTYSTETIARIPANLPGVGYGGATGWDHAATGNGDNFAVWIAGNSYPSPSQSLTGTSVFKLMYSNDTWNHSTPWNLAGPGNRMQKAGMTSSDTGAYIVGGSYPSNTAVQKISFADMTNSVVTNSASPGRTDLTATGNPSSGYYAGGATGNNANGTGGSTTSIVEKMNFSTESISRIPSLDLANSLSKTGSMSATGDNKILQPQYRWVDNAPASFNFGYSMTGRTTSNWAPGSEMGATYKVDYGTDTSAAIPLVAYGYEQSFGGGNSTHAYKMGGRSNDVPADGSEIQEKFAYATDTRLYNTSTYGNRRYGSFAVTHGETTLYGVGGRGSSSNQLQVNVYKMPYSSDTWSTASGAANIATARRNGASVATSTHGYFAGGGNLPGNPASPIYRSDVDKMTFATETTDRIPSANLLSNVLGNRGFSRGGAGYIMGGVTPSGNYLSNLDKITFSTDTTSAFPSNLPDPVRSNQTMSSDSSGYATGGQGPAPSGWDRSTVSKMSYSTGTFSAAGNLPTYQHYGIGMSAGSDNLPFQVPPTATPTPIKSAVPVNFGLRIMYNGSGTNVGKIDFTTDSTSKLTDQPGPFTASDANGGWNDNVNGKMVYGTAGGGPDIFGLPYTTGTVTKISNAPITPGLNAATSKVWTYSTTHGFFSGGRSYTPSYPSHHTNTSRYTFSTDTIETSYPSQRLVHAVEAAKGVANSTHAYVTGGRTDNPGANDRSYVQKASFSTGDFAQVPSANLNAVTTGHNLTGNLTSARIAGKDAYGGDQSPESRFQKLTYSNDTMTTLPGSTLPGTPSSDHGKGVAATGNQTQGYFGGSDAISPPTNVKIVYATDTTSETPAWANEANVRDTVAKSACEQNGNGTSQVPNMMK